MTAGLRKGLGSEVGAPRWICGWAWRWLERSELVSAWCTPPVSISCIIFQTNHLRVGLFCIILKTKEIVCKIFKTLELWFLWSFGGDTSLKLVDSVSYLRPNSIGRRALRM